MESKVGCSWRQLELRGQQNSAKSKQIFSNNSSLHTFVVERENDGNSLLRFMKVVVPEYRELIPPPCLSNVFRPVQCRLSARIQSTESIGAPAPRQFRQNTETTMALNAFSDLEAIAEMGAGTDETESQLNETTTHLPSKLIGHCSPNSANNFPLLAQQNIFSAPCDQRMRQTEQQNKAGVSSEATQLAQMSMEQQQRQRFGMNVVYRQQQTKQPITPIGGINPTTGRLMDNQPGLRHSSSTDVFNFVPDHSPFEDSPNFGNISMIPYQSPTGVTRRRGRGRRAGNFGDRQPSTSSVEHEGTPESPSEFGTLRKPRGANSGQRRPRKPRKPANVSFDVQEGISRSPFQNPETHPTIGQIPPLPNTPSQYISAQIEDDFRSKMMSVYEMGICESSTDDEEMDPPPPPKGLIAHKHSESSATEQKMISDTTNGIGESGGNATKKCVPPLAKCSVSSSYNQSGDDRLTDSAAEPPQNAQLLQDLKFFSAVPSSPAFSHLSELNDYRMPMAVVVKTDLEMNQKQRTSEKIADLYDDEIDGANRKKKEAEMDRLNQMKDVQPQLNILAQNKMPFSSCLDQTSKESHSKKDNSLNSKRPSLVLKIKKEGGASSAASTKHSSSSSSPSSTSSSTAAPPPLPCPPPPQQPQQQINEPVARLSSSAAPPSKYKQQRKQMKRTAGKDEATTVAVTAPPSKKKQRKTTVTTSAEGQSSPPPSIQQHRPSMPSSSTSNTATTKWVKEGGNGATKSGAIAMPKKESTTPSVISQITVPFPTLKNFKIPKVIENAEPPLSTSNYISSKGGPLVPSEHQQQSSQHGGGSVCERGSRKFGSFKSSEHFDRRSGGGAKQTAKGGHPPAHYQYNDKFVGGGGNSFQSHNTYNRQRTSKQQQMGGGGRHGGANSELPRKQHGSAASTTRSTLSSSSAGHRFTFLQHNSREAGPSHTQHNPLPSQHLQNIPAQQQFSNVGWQAVQPTTGEFLHQQQNNSYLPQQQRVELFGQANDQTEHRQHMSQSTITMRPNQARTTDRLSGNSKDDERTDNSPSAGNGLQIVDDE